MIAHPSFAITTVGILGLLVLLECILVEVYSFSLYSCDLVVCTNEATNSVCLLCFCLCCVCLCVCVCVSLFFFSLLSFFSVNGIVLHRSAGC